MASPTSIEPPLKIATWAQRAAGPQTIAPVIAPGMDAATDGCPFCAGEATP